ncbi:MAG: hypothetical protein ACI4OI_07735 [Gemmiger sp.]
MNQNTTAAELEALQKTAAQTASEVNKLLKATRQLKSSLSDALPVEQFALFGSKTASLRRAVNELGAALGAAIQPITVAMVPAIESALAAMTRLAGMAAVVTGALFGKKKLAAASDGVAESAEEAAKAEKKLASSTGSASKAAKGALAAFDELDVLQSRTASGSSGSGTTVTVTTEEEGDDAIDERLQAIIDKIRALLEPLLRINFGPLKQAFEGLKAALAPLTRDLFAGLEWAWYNLLVPLAAWTIQDALPTFLDLLAAGCRALTAALEVLGPLAVWLWESILQPVVSFLGNVFLAVLDAVTAALNGLALWISENRELFEILVITAAGLAAAWALVNGALSLWAGISALATAATTAFGAAIAFLTSPIGLVVGAIGALIAASLLLYRNWDTVNAGIARLWESLADTIRGCVNGILGCINGMIAGLVSGINAVIGMLNGLSFTIPDWVPQFGGRDFGFTLTPLTAPQIPYLAQGAVIPPNREFLAVLGDQSSGTNIEAPLDTIKQAVAETLAGMGASEREIVIRFAASGGLEQLVRLLKPYIDRENTRAGARLITGGVYG